MAGYFKQKRATSVLRLSQNDELFASLRNRHVTDAKKLVDDEKQKLEAVEEKTVTTATTATEDQPNAVRICVGSGSA